MPDIPDILENKLLILASAGSGKTYQLGNRIIGQVARGAAPERIVALTFTRKAAAEFADSMLTKLAEAARDEPSARQLRHDLGLPEADFLTVLAHMVGSLHRMTLGTIDSFFAKIVRGFQYELGLTGGRFELLEGAQAEIVGDEILAHILGEVMTDERGDAFCHAYRRASIGKEQQGIARGLRNFISQWHQRFRQNPEAHWAPAVAEGAGPEAWEQHKPKLIEQALAGLDEITFTDGRQRSALEKGLITLRDHGIGSGSLGQMSSLMTLIFEQAAEAADGPLELSYYKKDFQVPEPSATAVRELCRLAARCELAAALQRTAAIREVVEAYDHQCAIKLRQQGKLGFDDVKLLMGQWAHSEDARLRREAVDFRLDSQIDHWLLDEFQDTSRADWHGLFPLVDEAAADDDRSLFIVGDRKQAIYAWRGGDVGLFDDVIERYAIKPAELARSWRSCPEVLSLVNRICADEPLVSELFGTTIPAWSCPEHQAARSIHGHSTVEVIEGDEDRVDRIEARLKQLGVGEREMSCGILFRGNKKARELANELRSRGFDVIYEGHREPGRDAPVGIAVTHLLKWLADPANGHARGTVEMSPLAAGLRQHHGETWREIWNSLTAKIATDGYHGAIAQLLADSPIEWSDFGRRRRDDVLAALARFDHQGGVSAHLAATLIERLELPQSPGTAAIQVMTIHKSKGLGFDVVILPDIPNEIVPSAQHFKIAELEQGWIDPPPQWARSFIPELADAEERWGESQKYDALCTLYVALTRAKHGLHVLLDAPKKSHDFDKPSLANWIFRATGVPGDDPTLFEAGDPTWVEAMPFSTSAPAAEVRATLRGADADSNPAPLTPSKLARHASPNPHGLQLGKDVHALLENIGWIDEQAAALPSTEAGKLVGTLLSRPAAQSVFKRDGRGIRLLREQAVDAVVDGRWITGVIDRLHLELDGNGQVAAVDIIDFKTDAITDAAELLERYRAQLDAYRQSLQAIYPGVAIRCQLLSTSLGELIEVS